MDNFKSRSSYSFKLVLTPDLFLSAHVDQRKRALYTALWTKLKI